MMARESWKYAELIIRLDSAGIRYMFEERLPGATHFYDLLLPDSRTAVEFDGPYHASPSQRLDDQRKNLHAASCGWELVRVPTEPSSVIPSESLDQALSVHAKTMQQIVRPRSSSATRVIRKQFP